MSLLKGLVLAVAALALDGQVLRAEVLQAECGPEPASIRSIGLDRSVGDVCADRFAVTPPPEENARIPVGDAAPATAGGRCIRFVPALAMTLPVDCPTNPEDATAPAGR